MSVCVLHLNTVVYRCKYTIVLIVLYLSFNRLDETISLWTDDFANLDKELLTLLIQWLQRDEYFGNKWCIPDFTPNNYTDTSNNGWSALTEQYVISKGLKATTI